MGRKLFKVAPNTAVVVEPFKNDYGNYIGIREFYQPRGNDEAEWLPTRNGLSIPLGEGDDVGAKAKKLIKAIKWAVENFEDEHKVLESKGKKKDKDKGKKKSDKNKKSKKRDDDEDDDE